MSNKELPVYKKDDLYKHTSNDASFYFVKKTKELGMNAQALAFACAVSVNTIYEITKHLRKGSPLPTLAPLRVCGWSKADNEMYVGKAGHTNIFSVAFCFDMIKFHSSNIKSMKFETIEKLVEFILDQVVLSQPVVRDEVESFIVEQAELPDLSEEKWITKKEVDECIRDYDYDSVETQLDVFYNTMRQLLQENLELKKELSKHKALPADYAALKRDQERLKAVVEVLGKTE